MTRKKSNIKWRNVILFLVVTVGLIALAQFFVIPDMVGWTIDRVKIYENGNDITIEYKYKFTDAYDFGVVLKQESCERPDSCDVLLTVSVGQDVSRRPKNEILEYLDSLVEAGMIKEDQIQTHPPEHSNDVNKDYAILYRPAPSEGIIEIIFSLGPEIIMREANMVAVGDVLLHDTVYEAFEVEKEQFDFSPLFSDIRRYIESANFAFVNQETNIGGVELGLSNYPNFNSPYEIVRDLTDVGFNMFSRANNHTLDRDVAGVMAAEEYWGKFEDIIHTGSTTSQELRDEIAVIERNGIKVALLAYSYGFNGNTLPKDQEYLANLFSFEQAEIDIKRAKEVADVIVVAMHWGVEYESLPSQTQKNQAQWLADQGVHAIIGSHPHVLQPVEFLTGINGNETLVAYSLGNFVSGQNGLETNVGGILSFDIQQVIIRDEVRVEIKNVELMPTYNYFDKTIGIYRIIPLIDSVESEYFEVIQSVMETFSDQINVVERLLEIEPQEEENSELNEELNEEIDEEKDIVNGG